LIALFDGIQAELDRYLHYYQRYQGHANGQKFAVAQQEGSTERRMVEMLQEVTFFPNTKNQ
jgi:ariadne-1